MIDMLDQKEICELIPHAGDMCLLDSVVSWDEGSIVCVSSTHTNKNNPLRNEEGLPMVSLIEYGAQAMAVHGCLLTKKKGGIMDEGYLAALRDIQLSQGLLSDVEEEIKVSAQRIYAEAGNMIYTMNISAGNKLLASGRATVVAKFDDE